MKRSIIARRRKAALGERRRFRQKQERIQRSWVRRERNNALMERVLSRALMNAWSAASLKVTLLKDDFVSSGFGSLAPASGYASAGVADVYRGDFGSADIFLGNSKVAYRTTAFPSWQPPKKRFQP